MGYPRCWRPYARLLPGHHLQWSLCWEGTCQYMVPQACICWLLHFHPVSLKPSQTWQWPLLWPELWQIKPRHHKQHFWITMKPANINNQILQCELKIKYWLRILQMRTVILGQCPTWMSQTIRTMNKGKLFARIDLVKSNQRDISLGHGQLYDQFNKIIVNSIIIVTENPTKWEKLLYLVEFDSFRWNNGGFSGWKGSRIGGMKRDFSTYCSSHDRVQG